MMEDKVQITQVAFVAEQLCIDILFCNKCLHFFPWGWFSSFFNGHDPKFCPVCSAKKDEEKNFFVKTTMAQFPTPITKHESLPLFVEILVCDTCKQSFPWAKDDQNFKYCPHCGVKFEK